MKYLPLLLIFTLLFSCHVTRQATTTHINTDSIVIHVRDSSAEVLRETSESFNEIIKQLTQSGVTFDNNCPDLDAIRASLDSIGKVNFDLAVTKDSVIHALNNKVHILADGSIEASGRVKAAFFSNSKLSEQLRLTELKNDSLWRAIDTYKAELSKKEVLVIKTVTKTKFPIWLLIIVACAGIIAGWVLKSKV